MCIKNFIVKHERDKVKQILKKQAEFRFDLPCKTDNLLNSRVYLPVVEPIGCVVDIHGGGLIAGSVIQNDPFCRWLANRGYEVYSINYPLIPEATFIEQLKYICEAVEEIAGYADTWSDARKPKFLFGDSAGALLALMTLGLTGYRDRVREDFGINTIYVEWDGVWLQSPMINTNEFDLIGLVMSHIYYEKGWKKEDYARYIDDPIWYLVADIPDEIVFSTSFEDSLRVHAEMAMDDIEDLKGIRPRCLYCINQEHDSNILYPYTKDGESVNTAAMEILEKYFEKKVATYYTEN